MRSAFLHGAVRHSFRKIAACGSICVVPISFADGYCIQRSMDDFLLDRRADGNVYGIENRTKFAAILSSTVGTS